MKVKFRTVLLVFLFIKLCILFNVLLETIESLSSDDHPRLLGTDDIYLFDLLLTIVASVFIAISSLLIIFFALGHNRFRKPYLIAAVAVVLTCVAPFFVSGLYLTCHDRKGLRISPRTNESFDKMFEIAENFNSTANFTDGVDPETMKAYNLVTHIQQRYCCCGIDGARNYGFTNKSTALKQSIPFTSKLEIRCPLYSLFKNSSCIDSHLHGCEKRIRTVYPTRILLYSSIGALFSVIFLILSPFMYSQFELDRRVARADYIRSWRRSIEQQVVENRMWAMRGRENETVLSDVSGTINENRSSPRV